MTNSYKNIEEALADTLSLNRELHQAFVALNEKYKTRLSKLEVVMQASEKMLDDISRTVSPEYIFREWAPPKHSTLNAISTVLNTQTLVDFAKAVVAAKEPADGEKK